MVAQMLATLVDRQEGVGCVVDVGAGNGRLLGELAAIRPDLQLSGIDLRARPTGLPDQVGWAQDLWDVRYGCWTTGEAAAALDRPEPIMIICCEWLDDLPCPVVAQHADGWREVIINDYGLEQPGPRLESEELAWADRWWPGGERAEIGVTRDRAWAELIRAGQEAWRVCTHDRLWAHRRTPSGHRLARGLSGWSGPRARGRDWGQPHRTRSRRCRAGRW